MNSQFWSILFIASCVSICLISVTNSSPFQRHSLHRRRQRLCGAALAEAVRFVCNGSYNGPDNARESEEKRYVVPYDSQIPAWNIMPYTYGFSNMRDASSILSSRSRNEKNKRQIVEECCKKSCSFYQLRAYCAPATEPGVEQIERDLMK